MNLRFQWTPEEWREALSLASQGPARAPVPVMTYAVVGIMSLGAVGEIFNALRSAQTLEYSNSIVPLLLFAGAVILAIQVYTRGVKRSRMGTPAPMPTDEQELLLSEKGWRFAATHATAEVRPWADLREQRIGERSLILVGPGKTFAALPLRALSESQGGHLHRLLLRKLRGQR